MSGFDDMDDEYEDDARARRVVSVMLKEGSRFWISAGAAGGEELPAPSEPFKLRVALAVALGKALGLGAREAAALGGLAQSQQEKISGLRWLRWSVELPEGSFDKLALQSPEGQSAMAQRFEQAVGVPLFSRFELDGLRGRGPGGDWASATREPADLMALFAALESKAIGRVAPAQSKGLGASRI
jgi:hypothetical protein